MRTLTSNPKFSGGVDTSEILEDVLDGIGFGGLWRSSTFHSVNEHDRQCTALTDRLIEVSQEVVGEVHERSQPCQAGVESNLEVEVEMGFDTVVVEAHALAGCCVIHDID